MSQRKADAVGRVEGMGPARREPGEPSQGVVGIVGLAAGFVGFVASQVEMIVRADGDYSFWGFAIVVSLVVGAVAAGAAAVFGVIAWAVQSTRRMTVLARAGWMSGVVGVGLLCVGVPVCMLTGDRLWITALTVAAAGSVAGCIATLAVSIREGRAKVEVWAPAHRRAG
jgi:hypothetical protein